jgi:hypothetical protein
MNIKLPIEADKIFIKKPVKKPKKNPEASDIINPPGKENVKKIIAIKK